MWNGDLLDIDNWDGKPEEITRHLDHLIDILHEVPDFVWQDRGGRPERLKGVRRLRCGSRSVSSSCSP